MSNCVDILTPRLVLTSDEINFVKLRDVVAHTPQQQPAWFNEPGYDKDIYQSWWFLSVEFISTDVLAINLGRGRSSHTWRDFEGFCQWLGQFMLKEKHLVFRMTDESDGHRRSFKHKVVLQPEVV